VTYRHALRWVLDYQLVTLIVTILVACLTVYLYIIVPKGFFPQDTGRIGGSVQAAQDISFQAMRDKMESYVRIVMTDPAVNTIVGFAGGTRFRIKAVFHHVEAAGRTREVSGASFLAVLPNVTADDVINRLRGQLAVVPAPRSICNPIKTSPLVGATEMRNTNTRCRAKI